MSKIDDVLDNVYSCEVRSDKEDKQRIISQAKKAICDEILRGFPDGIYELGNEAKIYNQAIYDCKQAVINACEVDK